MIRVLFLQGNIINNKNHADTDIYRMEIVYLLRLFIDQVLT